MSRALPHNSFAALAAHSPRKRMPGFSWLGFIGLVPTLLIGMALGGCTSAEKSPDVVSNIRRSLDQAGFKDVSVRQDRDNGVITLGGHVPSDTEKFQAASIAQSNAEGQVVANQIEVIPTGMGDARTIDADLDKGIKSNLAAALTQGHMQDVRYHVENGVVILSGNVNSESKRDHAAHIASRVPNVQQVVNELQVTNQKATSYE